MTLEELKKRYIEDELKQYQGSEFILDEGFNISKNLGMGGVVEFTNEHEENANTSIELNPRKYKVKGIDCEVISLFERKRNEMKTDANPIIYALKNKNGWKIKNKNELFDNLKKIISKLKLNDYIFAEIPTSGKLNSEVLHLIKKIHGEIKLVKPFIKLTVGEVALDCELRLRDEKIYKRIQEIIKNMNEDEIFEIKKVKPESFRQYFEFLKCEQFDGSLVNSKIVIFDDTITSGTTLKLAIKEIEKTYSPKEIKILTLFSPLSS